MKEINNTTLQERYELGVADAYKKKVKEVLTGKAYISVAKKFLKSGKRYEYHWTNQKKR